MSGSQRPAHITGVAMTPFGKHLDRSLRDLATEICQSVLRDAGMTDWPLDGPVFFANAAGGSITGQEMIAGQVALAGTALEGAPVVNVENACASGGTAVHLATQAVMRGDAEVACAIGVEKLFHEDKARSLDAIKGGTNLLGPAASTDESPSEGGAGSVMMHRYAQLAHEYLERTGAPTNVLAMVAAKNRDHASRNSNAQFREPASVEEALEARTIVDPLTLFMCSPITDGASAVIVANRERARASSHPVAVLATSLASYRPRPAPSVVERASETALGQSRLGPLDLDLLEVHDASAIAEIIQYEEIGLAPADKGHELVTRGDTKIGGSTPVNPSGGLLSRGHPLAATGCAQITEIVEQIRGRCGDRQVERASRGMAVNAGGWMDDDYAAAAVTVLSQVSA